MKLSIKCFKGSGKRGHIVAHDVSWAAQTGKHLLRTQNVSEQNQKHFLNPAHKICVCNKCCACGQTGKHLCRQQCVHNDASSFARALSLWFSLWDKHRSLYIFNLFFSCINAFHCSYQSPTGRRSRWNNMACRKHVIDVLKYMQFFQFSWNIQTLFYWERKGELYTSYHIWLIS